MVLVLGAACAWQAQHLVMPGVGRTGAGLFLVGARVVAPLRGPVRESGGRREKEKEREKERNRLAGNELALAVCSIIYSWTTAHRRPLVFDFLFLAFSARFKRCRGL